MKVNPNMDEEYDVYIMPVIGYIIHDIQTRASAEEVSFAQQHLLHQGLKKFGKKGREASLKEVDQLHKRNCFTPIFIDELTPQERKKAVQALMFLSEKHDGTVKVRLVYNSANTRK